MNRLRPSFSTSLTVLCIACLPGTSFAQEQAQAWTDGAVVHQSNRAIHLPHLGLSVTQSKVFDSESGQIRTVTVDQDGDFHDLSTLLRSEQRLRSEHPTAKIHASLAQALKLYPYADQRVAVWLTSDMDKLDRRALELHQNLPEAPSEADLRHAEETMDQFVRQEIQAIQAPALALAQALGLEIRHASVGAPVLFTHANSDQVKQLALCPQVDTIYLEQKSSAFNTSANETHRSDQTQVAGITGSGVQVAILENSGVDPLCPHLNVSEWYDPAVPVKKDHVHAVAGCVASQLPSRLGGAPGVTLVSANSASLFDSDVVAAADWSTASGTDITNLSFGKIIDGIPQFMDRYIDYQSRYFQDSFVAAAGNVLFTAHVASPAAARNCIAVGAFDDLNTGSWSDDGMSSFSCFINPVTGCIKPNLVAVGSMVDTIGGASDWTFDNFSGTSASAPFTCGALALMLSQRPQTNYSPEAAMAGLMATAWHNIEGSSRLSDRDGAGGLHQLAAARAANKRKMHYTYLAPEDFLSGPWTQPLKLRLNEPTRVCIAWSARSNATYTSTVMEADLDLLITRSTGGPPVSIIGSFSTDNNYEIVEFTPTALGTYSINILAPRFDGAVERIGIAWSQRGVDLGD